MTAEVDTSHDPDAAANDPEHFARRLLSWFENHGRHDLPWQREPTPYRVWISEIMLQQTQVRTVIPYYERFIERFPQVDDLAAAHIDKVLHLWTGLGYYARARNLHKAAQAVVELHHGRFPESVEALELLPGIGKSTAGAIAALSMQIRAPILDGNVKRVLARYHAIGGWPEQTAVKKQLWELAEQLTPRERVDEYTQAIMDLGATLCTRSTPSCQACPLNADCEALSSGQIASFPGKKPRKTLPVRTVTMFILQNDAGEVLLEKRPPQGVWGSLYSLPENVSAETSPTPDHVGLDEKAKVLEPIRHSFSHYHLDIQPKLIKVGRQSQRVAESDRWLWYPLDHSVEVGLAAPIKKLLGRLPLHDDIEHA